MSTQGEHEPAPDVDLDVVRSEIEAEARRLRASGEIGADLERELELVFARFAPVDAVQGDFEAVMVRVDELTQIDLNPPLDTTNPAVALSKRLIRKTIRWYVRWVASQTSGLGHALARATRLLSARLDALESALPPPDGSIARIARLASPADDRCETWRGVLATELANAPGRVVVADCGTGDVLRLLSGVGVDAYGVEPVEALAQQADEAGLEARHESISDHLHLVPDGALGGIVLIGLVDRQRPGRAVELLDLATAKLAQGGTLIIVGTHPGAWTSMRSPVEVDLSPGRPLHPETWVHLLASRPFDDATVQRNERADRLDAVPGTDRAAAVLNDNLRRLNELLFPASEFAVIAHRQ